MSSNESRKYNTYLVEIIQMLNQLILVPGGDDPTNYLKLKCLSFVRLRFKSHRLATSIVSELRDTNDREGSRYLVRLLNISQMRDSGIRITFNNIEQVYDRYLRSGLRGAKLLPLV